MAENSSSDRDKNYYEKTAKMIEHTSNPWKAMDLGNIKTDNKWKQIKIDVMQQIMTEKYLQCADYRDYLGPSLSQLELTSALTAPPQN